MKKQHYFINSVLVLAARTGSIGWMLILCSFTLGWSQSHSISTTEDSNILVSHVGQKNTVSPMNQIMSIDFEGVPLLDALKQVTDNLEMKLSYSKEVLPVDKKIIAGFEKTTANEIIYALLEGTGLRYAISEKGSLILFRYTEELRKSRSPDKAQVVSGTVTEAESGERLPGVNIMVKGTEIGTSTDGEGNFELDIPSLRDTLIVSFVGYQTQQIPINGRTQVDIVMVRQVVAGDEMVVVGFGEQEEESLVSSVSSVEGQEISMPTRNLTNSLAGRVAGLIAVQRSGEPGYDNAEFWIRGISSFAGGTNPLVLVDGIPRSMSDVEPDMIESFSVLKDAAATAIYGAEGANGVVIITTKRGKNQKTSISYRGEYTGLEPTRLPEFLGAGDYMRLYNEALINEGNKPIFSNELIRRHESGEDPDLYPDVNWMNMLRETTSNNRHTLSFRGGGEKARFFISGAYFQESGIFKSNPDAEYENNIGLKRYNLRSNVDFDVTNTTLLSVDLSGKYRQGRYPGNIPNLFTQMTLAPPYVHPMKFSDGTIAGHPDARTSGETNPYNLLMESGYSKQWRSALQSKVAIDQDLSFLTKGLKVRGLVSYDANTNYYMDRPKVPAQFIAVGRGLNGELRYEQVQNESAFGDPIENSDSNKNIYLEASMNYHRVFTNKHDVGGMLLYYQKERQLNYEALPFRKQAFVGRGTYVFDNRYSIEANFGMTGSETFAKGHRFGIFPAVGLAWIIDNEPFFRGTVNDVISGLKVRASIGRTGNDNTGGARFLYRGTYVNSFTGWNKNPASQIGYPLGIGGSGVLNYLGGLVEGQFEQPNISWEIEDKRNIGIDLELFEGRINLKTDYFDNLRHNILLQRRTVSAVTGFRNTPWQNYGKVSNRGLESSFEARNNFGEFLVSFMGNMTFARNKILEYDEIEQAHPWMNITGTRLNSHNLYVAERLLTRNDFTITTGENGREDFILKDHLPESSIAENLRPGDILYKDLNGDGVIDNYDQTRKLGNPSVPELVYGFGLNLDYKNLYFNVFFQGAGNTSTVLGGQNPAGFFPFRWGVTNSSARKETLDRWTAENPSQDVLFPRMTTSYSYHNQQHSTWWLRDASFLRLKNAEIGYRFNQSMLQNIGVTNARIYVKGYNLHVWDKIKMWDPEMGNANAGMNYPLQRSLTFGLEFTL